MEFVANWIPISKTISDAPNFLPADYFTVLGELGAGEGFVGEEYIRLYEPSDLISINKDYCVGEYLPGFFLIGSTGCGEAYCYKIDCNDHSVYKVPFIPFNLEYVEKISNSLSEMLRTFSNQSNGKTFKPDPETQEKEIFEKHPIVLGGDPESPSNKVFLEIANHKEAVIYWNKIFDQIKKSQQ